MALLTINKSNMAPIHPYVSKYPNFLLGEHIRNWRSRYFILKDDGLFIGFRQKPASEAELNDPLNNFTVRNCEIIESSRPKPFTFAVRGLQACHALLREF